MSNDEDGFFIVSPMKVVAKLSDEPLPYQVTKEPYREEDMRELEHRDVFTLVSLASTPDPKDQLALKSSSKNGAYLKTGMWKQDKFLRHTKKMQLESDKISNVRRSKGPLFHSSSISESQAPL